MKKLQSTVLLMKNLFLTPVSDQRQKLLILLVAVLFIFMPAQPTGNDWQINTEGLWDDLLHTYDNPDRVYPPWGLILLIPFYLMHIGGVRFLSVLVIGWLVKRRNWTIAIFFTIVFSPYFLNTMYLVNMDIFVLVFPILLWEFCEDKKWAWVGRGLALALLLLKPQAAILIWMYLIWQNRKQWQALVPSLAAVGIITLPISLVGSPPLIFQWLENISNPSTRNIYFWTINNVSLTAYYSPFIAVTIVTVLAGILIWLYRKKHLNWDHNAITASLLMISMLLSPYASQQSVSASFAFVPSIGLTLVQYFLTLFGGFITPGFIPQGLLRVLVASVCALIFYAGKPLHSKKSAPLSVKSDLDL